MNYFELSEKEFKKKRKEFRENVYVARYWFNYEVIGFLTFLFFLILTLLNIVPITGGGIINSTNYLMSAAYLSCTIISFVVYIGSFFKYETLFKEYVNTKKK